MDNNNFDEQTGGSNDTPVYKGNCGSFSRKKITTPGVLFTISVMLMYGINFIFDIAYIILGDNGILWLLFKPFLILELGMDIHGFNEWACLILSILSLIGFILMIVLRVKYPEYKNGKYLMWITVSIIGFIVIVYGYIVVTCSAGCHSMCRPFE